MKCVLVTGGSGFVGRHVLRPLLRAGFAVHVCCVSSGGSRIDGVSYHACDLWDAAQVDALLSVIAPTHLLHLAWYTQPGLYWNSDKNLTWVAASLNLARAFVAHGGKRFVGAGSCAEYDWRFGYCSEGTTPTLPKTLYGRSKAGLADILSSFAQVSGISFAWGRLFFLYGPEEHPSRLVPSVTRALLAGEDAKCSVGTQLRDFQDVRDAGGAFAALLGSAVEGTINIASGRPLAVKDLASMIATQLGAESRLKLGALPLAADEPPLLVADIRRLRNEVGWIDQHDLASGLADAIAWWRSRPGE